MSNRSMTIDLHPVFNRGGAIDAALREAFEEAERRKATELEIIHGKGSGQLRKRVLRYVDEVSGRLPVHRVIKDQHNHGRVVVTFRWPRGQ